MKLVIDRGNTLFKLGVFDGRDLIEVRYLQELNKSTLEDILLTFDVSKAILCSVGGNLSQDLTDLLKAQTNFLSMSNTLSLPIKISYNNPNALVRGDIYACNRKTIIIYLNSSACIVLSIVVYAVRVYQIPKRKHHYTNHR